MIEGVRAGGWSGALDVSTSADHGEQHCTGRYRPLTRHLSGSAARNRRQDMDDSRGRDRRREIGRLAIDEDVDVRAEPRSGFDQSIAQARHGPIERLQDEPHGPAPNLVAAFNAREQGQKGAWQQDGCHRVSRRARLIRPPRSPAGYR